MNPSAVLSKRAPVWLSALAFAAAALPAVAANTPPVISGTPPASVAELATYVFQPTASDVDGNTLRFRIEGRPSWATFDSATGRLTGTPNNKSAGVYSGIKIRVSDGRVFSELPTFSITVNNTNMAPSISGTPATTVTAGQPYSFQPTGADQDGDVLTYKITNKPSWATFDTVTGKLSGTPSSTTSGTTSNVTISVSDGSLSASLPAFNLAVKAGVGNDQPKGIYSLEVVVDRPWIDGVVVKQSWADYEPTEGVYNFRVIEELVREASALGQKVSIINFLGTPPAWLVNKVPAESRYSNLKGITTIVPWDTTMLAAIQKLANAQAAFKVDGVALKDHPAVKQVMAGIGGTTHIRLLPEPPGYTYDKFAGAVEKTLGYWATAYPKDKYLYVGLFHFNPSKATISDSELIRDRVMTMFDGVSKPRMHFFEELLTGVNPDPSGPNANLLRAAKGRTGIMFQACGPWTTQLSGEGPWSCEFALPLDSPEIGARLVMENFDTKYIEFYAGDLRAPEYDALFARIREAMDVGTSVLQDETPQPPARTSTTKTRTKR